MPGGAHDRLIGFLSKALPIAIGAIAAVMLLSPLSQSNEVSFLLDRNKVAITKERIRVSHAMYRGQDKKGQPFSLTAGSAVQQSSAVPVVKMEDIVARLLLSDGPAELFARQADYNFSDSKVAVVGPVDLRSASGYRLVARGVSVDLRNRRITGSSGVDGALPAGSFKSDRIFVDLDGRVVTLDGNARLRMDPAKLRENK